MDQGADEIRTRLAIAVRRNGARHVARVAHSTQRGWSRDGGWIPGTRAGRPGRLGRRAIGRNRLVLAFSVSEMRSRLRRERCKIEEVDNAIARRELPEIWRAPAASIAFYMGARERIRHASRHTGSTTWPMPSAEAQPRRQRSRPAAQPAADVRLVPVYFKACARGPAIARCERMPSVVGTPAIRDRVPRQLNRLVLHSDRISNRPRDTSLANVQPVHETRGPSRLESWRYPPGWSPARSRMRGRDA
jgi:hypothetical protein